MRLVAVLACAMLLICLGVASGHAEKRVALVIGNSAYQNTPALPNPKNDATDMASALRALGFEVVFSTDLNKRGMDEAFGKFARLARDADAALFFYAGHGIQFAGSNYLMPTDAKLQDEADLPYEMAKVDDVISDLSRARNVRIVILDACRDNPLAERLRMNLPASRSGAVSRGLARIERTQGLITAFATQPGQVAADGAGTRNSPFTGAILKHMAMPSMEATTLFRRVAQDVNQSTGGKQLPEISISLLGDFYFSGEASGPTPAPVPALSSEAERAWVEAKDSKNQAVLEEFVRRFGDSFYAALARVRLDELKKSQGTVAPLPLASNSPLPLPQPKPSTQIRLDGWLNFNEKCKSRGVPRAQVDVAPKYGKIVFTTELDAIPERFATTGLNMSYCVGKKVEHRIAYYIRDPNNDSGNSDHVVMTVDYWGSSKPQTVQITYDIAPDGKFSRTVGRHVFR
jgi:hypothetical protein